MANLSLMDSKKGSRRSFVRQSSKLRLCDNSQSSPQELENLISTDGYYYYPDCSDDNCSLGSLDSLDTRTTSTPTPSPTREFFNFDDGKNKK